MISPPWGNGRFLEPGDNISVTQGAAGSQVSVILLISLYLIGKSVVFRFSITECYGGLNDGFICCQLSSSEAVVSAGINETSRGMCTVPRQHLALK